MKRHWKLTSAVVGAALALASTGPVLAQETMDPQPSDRYEGETAGLTTPNQFDNFIEVGPSSGFGGGGSFGHASASSYNTHGDIAEGLSNQPMNDDG